MDVRDAIRKTDLTRRDSQAIKGWAICLVLLHHLFGLPTLIVPPAEYVELVPDVPIEYWIGRYGKVAVALFLLVTGYGLARSAHTSFKDQLVRVWRFATRAWFYFAVFVPMGFFLFSDVAWRGINRFTAEPWRLVTNALFLRHDYNYEWWFTEPYILILLAAPALLWLSRRPLWIGVPASLALFVIGAVMDQAKLDPGPLSISAGLIWQFPFMVGAWYSTRGHVVPVGPVVYGLSAAIVAALVVGIDAIAPNALTPALILTSPVSGLLALGVARSGGAVTKTLVWLGKYTMPIWLSHSFYCYYFFQPDVYSPLLSVLVFCNLLSVSILTALILEPVRITLFRWLSFPKALRTA